MQGRNSRVEPKVEKAVWLIFSALPCHAVLGCRSTGDGAIASVSESEHGRG